MVRNKCDILIHDPLAGPALPQVLRESGSITLSLGRMPSNRLDFETEATLSPAFGTLFRVVSTLGVLSHEHKYECLHGENASGYMLQV